MGRDGSGETALKRRKKERAILHRNGSVAVAKGKRLKSIPIKPRSKKRAKLMREVRAPLVREILEERPLCERGLAMASLSRGYLAGNVYPSSQVHEKLTRARGGDITDKENCVALCRACHNWIHDHPAEATEEGWLEHRKPSVKIMPRRWEVCEC